MLGRGQAIRLGLVGVAGALAVAVAAPSVAPAAFPGVNGQIAFTRSPLLGSGDQIFTMDPSGAGQTNVSGNADDLVPNWSPDGRLIAFFNSGTSGDAVWVMNADGSNRRQVFGGTFSPEPAFSADGSRIFFIRRDGSNDAVWVVGVDGSSPHALFTPPAGHVYFGRPAPSPDGSRIAFSDSTSNGSQSQIVIANADGSGTPQAIPNQGGHFNAFPDWSPDSSQIVFSNSENLGAQLVVIGVDGSNRRTLTDLVPGQLDFSPHFSPDGSQVAFSRGVSVSLIAASQASDRQTALTFQEHIWKVPAAGGAPQQLTSDPTQVDGDPAWQPQPSLLSVAQVAACSRSGAVAVTVSDQAGFKSPPSAVHFQLDGGAEQTVPTSGSAATATVSVPVGTHTLTYWGEDQAGYQEAAHHTASVLVDRSAPSVTIAIDQRRSVFPRGARVTTTTIARDSGGLAVNPTRRHVRQSTARLGLHTVRATAVDRCGNRRTRTVHFRVVAARRHHARFTG